MEHILRDSGEDGEMNMPTVPAGIIIIIIIIIVSCL